MKNRPLTALNRRLNRSNELSAIGPGGLLGQYREMANDLQHEVEAEEWSEGLIGDAYETIESPTSPE